MWIAYVDLKAAFDSVDRESLWLLLRRHGIPDKLVELMKELYTGTCSCVLSDGMRSEWFQVLSGVRQGCTVAPDLFPNPMDRILNRTVEQVCSTVSGCKYRRRILLRSGLYADDVTLLAEMLETLVAALMVLQDEAAPLGLQVKGQKRRSSTSGNHVRRSDPVDGPGGSRERRLGGRVYLPRVAISHDGGSEAEIPRRIGISRECFSLLEKNIWRSHILTD